MSHISINTKTKALAAAISNPRRMRIVEYLNKVAFSTNGFTAKHLKLYPSQVTKDLRVLVNAGLVNKEKFGKLILYELNAEKYHKLQSLM
jgi:DNA-binding transcriptional ArsR family regulator